MAGCHVPSRPATASTTADADSVEAALGRVRDFIEPRLDRALTGSPEAAPRLVEAMRYAVLAPGKRLRPALALWACQACGGSWEAAAPAAVAVELIHAYSLVHDDLPAMDDDDLRRGRPTCHRAFDEATAILCGDALQALAFETLARDLPPDRAGRACLVLARAAGAEALVGGQADDLAAERGWIGSLADAPAADQVAWMDRINRRKTAALFLAALELGGLAAGADAARLELVARFGRAFGQAFQIADDLLDAEGSEAAVGKRVGKDAGRGKLTFPTVEGAAAARSRAAGLAAAAVAAAAELGESAGDLGRLAAWIVGRSH
ncbi:MAG: polyprenyl synthetase family protein [Planctomycetaceae bacterium]